MERKVLWEPRNTEQTQMFQFQEHVAKNHAQSFSGYKDFHRWSVENTEFFWEEILHYYNPIREGEDRPIAKEQSFLDYPWFPNVKLNFAENLLSKGDNSHIALNFRHESGKIKKISYSNLKEETNRVQSYLEGIGFKKQDVLACYMPNIPETVMAMLGATSLGGVFTSTSSDFGIQGVLDRFSQSKPKILVTVTGYEYNGKYFDLIDKVSEVKEKIPSIEKVIYVDFLGKLSPDEKSALKNDDVLFWDDLQSFGNLTFEKVEFNSPLYIMYSSGTTGKPKCIVHGVGGTLLQHWKELALHTDVRPQEKLFYFTTCGWMMWNWLVSGLAVGAEVVLYEGSPGYPSLGNLMKWIDEEGIHIWGTSPKFLRALETHNWENESKFENLRAILSTGAPLLPEQFDYIQTIKKNIQIASICGGTDIISCFMLGSPTRKVYRGEIQCLGLGMDVACLDSQGKLIFDSEGELVCRKPFISQPIYFLDDEDKQKIIRAYFSRFENTWHHGDFITITSDMTVRVFGRSDATLNPGGVRIGTGEIYRQTEKLEYIDDTLCVGKKTEDGDVDVVLFVKFRSSETKLTEDLTKEIKTMIRNHTTPRHVPKFVYKVTGIPYTRSGKKMELAITRLLNGRQLDNVEAMANPECLKEYQQYL